MVTRKIALGISFLGVLSLLNGGLVAYAAVVIDFESVDSSVASPADVSSPFVEDGFEISDSVGVFQTLSSSNESYTGSTAFYSKQFFQSPPPIITLKNSADLVFDFETIDLARLNRNQTGSISVLFRGFNGGTEVATDTKTIDLVMSPPSPNSLETFVFGSGFDAVTSVTWERAAGTSIAFQFDNVSVTAVPEPLSLVFLGASFGFVGLRRYQRRFA